MEKQSVFTFFKRYRFIGIVLLLILTGCQSSEPINSDTPGWFNHYFVYSFSVLIKWVAALFGDNYGIAIILITNANYKACFNAINDEAI